MRHATPMDLLLETERPAGVGARQHLVEQLRDALLSGRVAAGSPLPSTRVLASTMRVSRGTAVAAYEELAGEGYLVIRPGSGTFAAEEPLSTPSARAREKSARRVPPSPAPRSAPHPVSTINLWPGSPAARLEENRDWRAAWRAATSRAVPALPPEPAGLRETRERIAEHLLAARGIDCGADEVLLTAGTGDGLALLLLALAELKPSPIRIATEDPGYSAARRVITRLGGEAVPVPVGEDGMDLGALAAVEEPLAAALLTPSHQYPLGGRMPVTRRLSLLQWAEERDAIVIEDDYDSEFRHGAPALPAIASLDAAERVVHIGSYSKTVTPWLRCGYAVVFDPRLRAAMLEVRADLGHPVPGVLQLALAEFMRNGGLKRHLARMGREYAHRRALVIEAARSVAPAVRLDAVEGGLHAVLSWDGEPPAEEVVARLLERSIRVAPLTGYYHPGSPRVRNGIVFGYGAPSDTQLHSALEAIAAVLSRLPRARPARGGAPPR